MSSPVQVIFQPSTTALVAAVASLLSLYLLWKMSQSSSGFKGSYAQGSAWGVGSDVANLYGGVRDDTGSRDDTRVVAGFNANRGFKPRVLGGFLGNMEPPVFWNPGSYAAVGNAQQDGIAAEGTGDDGTAWDASAGMSGFLGKKGFSAQVPAPY